MIVPLVAAGGTVVVMVVVVTVFLVARVAHRKVASCIYARNGDGGNGGDGDDGSKGSEGARRLLGRGMNKHQRAD